MTLEQYKHDMQRCTRCTYCTWVPFEDQVGDEFIKGCPSEQKYLFNLYTACGKWNLGYSLINDRIDINDRFQDSVFRCQMCGLCDVSCKSTNEIETLDYMYELRSYLVEKGYSLPRQDEIIAGLEAEDNMLGEKKKGRGDWAKGMKVKDLTMEKAEVAFRAGCRYSYDKELWPIAQGSLQILIDAGVDVGIWGDEEVCCGGRAYSMGFAGEMQKYAEHNIEDLKAAGVKTIVTPCSDCYQAYKVLYAKIGAAAEGVEVLHITEYIKRLIDEGKIKFTKEVPLTVTYHDPCHLGRMGEPWIEWDGVEVKKYGTMICHEPPKKYRRGANPDGYEIPRQIIESVPGVKLVEMPRNREGAWCCGAGGGVKDTFPEFALWTAGERLKEAKSLGVDAMVTACGWCTRNFVDAMNEGAPQIDVIDIIELVRKAM